MVDEIILKFIGTSVGFITTGVLGYLVAKLKDYKKRDINQEEALKCLLRSNITSKYFIYTELGCIPEYEKENVNYLAECYFSMGGNSYVKTIIKLLERVVRIAPTHTIFALIILLSSKNVSNIILVQTTSFAIFSLLIF